MSQKEIITGNTLIANFMGEEVTSKGKWQSKHNGIMDFQYHSSWDWLMPVVEKIEYQWSAFNDDCIYDEHEYSDFKICETSIDLDTSGSKNGKERSFQFYKEWSLKDKSEELKRINTWDACVKFIGWLNSATAVTPINTKTNDH